MVAHPLEHDDRAGGGEDVRELGFGRPVGGGEQAAVHVETRDCGEHLPADLVDRQIGGHLGLREEGVQFGRKPHQAAHGEP